MKKYNCEYQGGEEFAKNLNKDDNWFFKEIEAENPQQACEKFLEEVGVYPLSVLVDSGGFFNPVAYFSDHIDSPEAKENAKNLSQPNIDAKTQDPDIEYQESGWALFLNICGFLNLILFVIAGIIWMNDNDGIQSIWMPITITSCVATINCFFFAFLVNTFTRIQHNTHQTTLELKN